MCDPPTVVVRTGTSRGELVLRHDGEHFEVISNGVFLMDTRDGRSERLLVSAALEAAPHATSVLIGGLGVGFSLDEAVRSPLLQRIVVVEIEPAIVEWHRTHLSSYSFDALADPRVEIVVTDLAEHLRSTTDRYDVICLDVDNGPDWMVIDSNASLYSNDGIQLLLSTLNPTGALAVWSASRAAAYEARLGRHLEAVQVHSVTVPRGEPDMVFVGRKPPNE